MSVVGLVAQPRVMIRPGGVPHSGYLRQATPAVHRRSGFENIRRYSALLVLDSSLQGLEVSGFLCVASA
jgi:hypothetical protein